MKYAGLLLNRVIILSPDLDTPPVYGPTPDGTPVETVLIPDSTECHYNWIYDPETKTFSEPTYPDPEPAPEPEEPAPTVEEQIAEVLLSTTEIQLTQRAQDETLAEILLNQIGG